MTRGKTKKNLGLQEVDVEVEVEGQKMMEKSRSSMKNCCDNQLLLIRKVFSSHLLSTFLILVLFPAF